MHTPYLIRFSLCSLFVFCFAVASDAGLRLPAVIGDNMVLQRDQPVPIWGWADKGEDVTVSIAGQTLKTKADGDGRWMVTLAKLSLGQPLEMTVKGSSGHTIALKNILVGDVWLCSGQSNMGMGVHKVLNAKEEIAAAHYPQIRLITVPTKGTQEPQHNFKGQWAECSPKTVGSFSATAYFFGRKLHQDLNIPIGLINCSWGGSSCEAWVKRSLLEADGRYLPMLKDYDKKLQKYDAKKADAIYQEQLASYKKRVEAAKAAGKTPPGFPFRQLDPRFDQYRPANCYNGMLLPLKPFAIRGVIWYQGESNAYQWGKHYCHLFQLLIHQWRNDWGQGDFPFIFVQLANYMPVKKQPSQSTWAELRLAQAKSLRVPNTGMAVTIDIGEEKDIHPKNKQDVGKRLALCALANVYGKKVVYSGPMYKSMEKKGNQIVIHFEHLGTGLTTKNGEPLKGFEIAGTDNKFVVADAKIVGNTVVVSSVTVSDPVTVRYAWADNPVCNLYNREGLPASPFHTDMWKEETHK